MSRKRVFEVNPSFAEFMNDELLRLGVSAQEVYSKTRINRSAFSNLKSQM